jgi:hypothetical protein
MQKPAAADPKIGRQHLDVQKQDRIDELERHAVQPPVSRQQKSIVRQ